jgi:mono/diheme cytochrome c family protein
LKDFLKVDSLMSPLKQHRVFLRARMPDLALKRCRLFVAAFVLATIAHLPTATATEAVDFDRDIRPILEANCWHCHGPDEQESGLRLDRRAAMLKGGGYGLATVVPGDPEKSYLIEVVNHVDPDMAMPPDEDMLPEAQRDLLRQWIAEGAVWPGQMADTAAEVTTELPWSFKPFSRPQIPDVPTSSDNPIDAFLLSDLHKITLAFSPQTDPATLIRRAAVVLTGLPPTPEDVQRFSEAFAANPGEAYTHLLDRLLDSPRFGERWAQHWLDVIRWAETNGSESNMYRKNAWIYRDYVIRAFNNDKPYNEFLFEQIAGDTVGQGDALGYLVSGPHVPVATVGQEPSARRQARADRMDEILQTVGASALGVTVGCARCHNHKFDPLTISDYYSLAAVFEDIEFGSRFPELGEDHPNRQQGQDIRRTIARHRNLLRRTGPWHEDWEGYAEIHFPPTTATAVRITFETKSVWLDEVELFGNADRTKNLALASCGTIIEAVEGMDVLRKKIESVNDGEYGTEQWAAKVPAGDDRKPWLIFNFCMPEEVDRIRLSSNRENFLATDFLTDIKPYRLPNYRVEVKDDSGTWRQIASSSDEARLRKADPARKKTINELQKLIAQFNREGPRASFIGRFIEPAVTHILHRGSPENPRDVVLPAAPSTLEGNLQLDGTASGPERRRAFADWLTAPDNPLPARVFVNRLWHHVFGQGIVTTPADFGVAGATPSHPDLLNWLAIEFVTPTQQLSEGVPPKPWSVKHMLRLMLSSQAFCQASAPRPEAQRIDSSNHLFWRFTPRRLEAEVIRDSILVASGSLATKVGGPSYRIHNVKKRYAQWEVVDNHGEDTWRRMIYQERMRRVDDQIFTAFDFPDCGQIKAKRPVSTTPLQALNLLNSPFVISQSKLIAARALDDSGGDFNQAVDRCFELLLARPPSPTERAAVSTVTTSDDLLLLCRAILNSNAFTFLE